LFWWIRDSKIWGFVDAAKHKKRFNPCFGG